LPARVAKVLVKPDPTPGARVKTVLHAWLEDSLLRGALLQAFDTCETPRGLARYLEKALRNWLIDRSRRRTGPRLLERAAEVMSSDPFVVVADSVSVMERWWGLVAWTAPAVFNGSDEEVASASWALGDFAILRFSSSERADPLLSTPDLRRYLYGLLDRLGAALSGRHVDHSFRQRFPYAYATSPADLDEAPEPLTTATPESEVVIADAARVALASLTERQARILLARPGNTLEALAASLGVSRGTVDNEYRRAVLKVREAAPSDDVFDEVLEMVVRVASE
jgi:RNA polymerase sigma factor (sigma-70 family)